MLWALFFFLHTAHAEEFVVRNRMNQPLTLHVIEKKECLARIAELTNAEGTIKQAISALTGEQSPSPLACLEDLTVSQKEAADDIAIPFEPPVLGAPLGVSFELSNQIGVLQAKSNCVLPGTGDSAKLTAFKKSHDAFCLRYIPSEEGPAINTQLAAAQKKMADWSAKTSLIYSLASTVASVFDKPQAVSQKRKEELSQLLDCYNPNEPGSASYKLVAERYGAACEGRWQTKAQWEAVAEELRGLNKKEERLKTLWTEQVRPGVAYVQNELAAGRVNESALEGLQQKIKCFNAQDPGTKAYGDEENKLKAQCPSGLTSAADYSAALTGVKTLFPNYAKATEETESGYPQAVEAAIEKQNAARRKRSAAYDDARFLAKLTHYLSHGGTLEQAEQFCADYESRQRDDAQLAKSGVEMFPFELARDWRNALAYGLTEGEFSSIRAYTRDFYTEINGAMRAGKALPPKLVHFRKVFDRALAQLPDYNATSVNRVDYFPAEVLKQYEEGAILRYDAYTSTSKAKDWLNNGKMDHKSVLYLAHGGKNIEDFSHYTDEEEILIRPGTRFKVLKKTSYPGAAAMFILGEVDEQGNLLAAPPEESK